MRRRTIDPGSGEKYFSKTKRVINPDGSFNVRRTGAGFHPKDIYIFLVNISWSKFFLIVLSVYILLNVFFAVLYVITGVEHLKGIETKAEYFLNAFYFSVQTFTTVGYGGIVPEGIITNLISSFEALTGWMTFALITGLLYGRFSHPSTRILFSKNAIIAPYRNQIALQFRIANQRRNSITDLEVKLIAVIVEKDFNKTYYSMKLERSNITFFPISWTIVHPIDEDSILWGKTLDELKQQQFEILILLKGFDDTFSQTVHSRYSYTADEMVWGARFMRTFNTDEEGEIIFDVEDIHKYEHIDLVGNENFRSLH